jgi:hypothetical protein
MSDAARVFKANRKVEGKLCGWCHAGLALGEEVAVCTACELEHHSRCWDGSAGCSNASCVNAPLTRLDQGASAGATGAAPSLGQRFSAFPSGRAASPGNMRCPGCSCEVPIGAPICNVCNTITSPDGLYHGPKTNAPGATASLVYGLIGLVFCGVVFGILAITKAQSAKRLIESDPRYEGGGLATAGFVLGIIDLIAFALILFLRVGAME